MKKYKCPLCPKKYQSWKNLVRHVKKIHDEILCEDCNLEIATKQCEKGSYLCYTCAGIHMRDGHKVFDLN